MRIQLISGHGVIGGGEQMLLRMAEAMRTLDQKVLVVGPSWGDLGAAVQRRDVAYRELRGANRKTYAAELGRYLLRRHGNLMWANGAMPALAGSFARDPTVMHLHQEPSVRQAAALRLAARRAVRVVVPSNFMARNGRHRVALENWTQELNARPALGSREFAEIGYIGRLSVDKGVDLLAQAVSLLVRDAAFDRPTKLLVAGDSRFVSGQQQEAVGEALKQVPVEVLTLGWIDPAAVYDRVDVCVVPSRWPEPFGLVAAEAMARECRVIVSNAGALPEVVGESHPWVFPAHDVEALAITLLSALTTDRTTPEQLARIRWEERFSPGVGTERLAGLLADLGL